MHPILYWMRAGLGNVVLGLALAGPLGSLTAQEPPPQRAAAPEVVAPSKREAPAAHGNAVVVPIGSTLRLQMRGKQAIDTVVNERENVATVSPVYNDPAAVTITGKEAGTTRLTLTGADRTVEHYQVIVQLDVEYLRQLLMRAVPTATLELIPAASGTVIISGTVGRAEDVDIIVRAAGGVLGAPERVVNAMRVEGVMQVQIDVKIVKVSRSELRNLSFNFIDVGHHHLITGTVNAPSASPLAGGVASTVGGPPSNLILGLFNDSQQFFAFLQALRTENVSKLLAEPSLVTTSGRSATFVSGGDQAVPEISGGGLGGSVGGIRFEPFGVRVSFLPIVLGNGKIHLEIEPEVSLPTQNPLFASPVPQTATGVIFGRLSNRVRTTVVMEDGQTFALGGMIQHTVDGQTQKLPILGDLPFIGAAFSSKSYNDAEDEIIIVVTPHLVDPLACGQGPGLLPGQETRSPDDFELFLEGILEAPRGPREVFPNKHYVPAYKNGPTAGAFPCGRGGCRVGTAPDCAAPAAVTMPPSAAATPLPTAGSPPVVPGTTSPAGVRLPDAGQPAPGRSGPAALVPRGSKTGVLRAPDPPHGFDN